MQFIDTDMKIGKLVRESFKYLVKEELLSGKLIEWLSDKKYCKQTFDINYPLLKKVEYGKQSLDQRLVNGYSRYWKGELEINGGKFFLCQEWYDRNTSKYKRWLEGMLNTEIKA